MIDIVIVNWNAGIQIYDCVLSLVNSENGIINTIVVVDNHSTDLSLDSVEGLFSDKVIILRNSENLGFSKACNIGAEYCSSDYILFLNPDCFIKDETLDKLDFFLNNYLNVSKLGVMGAQLFDEFGSISVTCSRFPTATQFLFKAVGFNFFYRFFPNLNHHMKEFDHLSFRHVDQVMGAFFLVPRKVFDTLNGFDERYFVYFEEVDFCLRVKELGYDVIFNPDVQAIHIGCGTTERVKAFRLFLSLSSRIKYFKKNKSLLSFLMIVFTSFFIEPFSRVVRNIVVGDLTGAIDVISAYIFFLKRKI